MHESRIFLLSLLALAAAGLLLLAACNGAIDDPDLSANMVSVGAFNPLSACVDVDGSPVDTNGDGTADTTSFTSTSQTVTLDSRLKGTATSNLNDVVFTKLTIDYEMTAGPQPPQHVEGIAVTVPAGGTADVTVDTVFAADIPAYFTLASRGNIRLTFSGKDVAGQPVTAVGRTAIEPATVCTSN